MLDEKASMSQQYLLFYGKILPHQGEEECKPILEKLLVHLPLRSPLRPDILYALSLHNYDQDKLSKSVDSELKTKHAPIGCQLLLSYESSNASTVNDAI